jgi:hypothetical protein
MLACPIVGALGFYLLSHGRGGFGFAAMMTAIVLWLRGGYMLRYGRQVDPSRDTLRHRALFAAMMAVLLVLIVAAVLVAIIGFSFATR